jgi:hypothetical protein
VVKDSHFCGTGFLGTTDILMKWLSRSQSKIYLNALRGPKVTTVSYTIPLTHINCSLIIYLQYNTPDLSYTAAGTWSLQQKLSILPAKYIHEFQKILTINSHYFSLHGINPLVFLMGSLCFLWGRNEFLNVISGFKGLVILLLACFNGFLLVLGTWKSHLTVPLESESKMLPACSHLYIAILTE